MIKIQKNISRDLQKLALIETKKRERVISAIVKEFSCLGATGIMSVGSLAWGKYYAVSKTSDLDLYVIGPMHKIEKIIKHSPSLVKNKELLLRLFEKFVTHHQKFGIKLFSLKTKLKSFPSSLYFLSQPHFKEICGLVDHVNNESFQEILFKNLRPNCYPQRKILRSFDGATIAYSTKFHRPSTELDPFYIRRDLFALVVDGKLYGSVFLSHLLSGEIILDKNRVLKRGVEKIWGFAAREFMKRNHKAKIFLTRNTNYGIINLINIPHRMNIQTKKRFNEKFRESLGRSCLSFF